MVRRAAKIGQFDPAGGRFSAEGLGDAEDAYGGATIAFFFDAGTGRDGQGRLTRAPGQAVASDADRDGFANESPGACGSALQHSELCRGALIVGSGDVKHLLAGRRQDGGDFGRQLGGNGHAHTGGEHEKHYKEAMHGANSIEGGVGDLAHGAAITSRRAPELKAARWWNAESLPADSGRPADSSELNLLASMNLREPC
jgi:hypothetical protein